MRRFAEVEPETRGWIDAIPADGSSVLWDVGANVGVFSIYAAMRGIRVVAVEPAPHNLMLLTRNVALNRLETVLTVLPNALADVPQTAMMKLSSLEFGSARHGFGTTEMFRGRTPRDPICEFSLVGTSLDRAVSDLQLPGPTHIKIDVDGIELAILVGAHDALRHVAGLCVELKHNEQMVDAIVGLLGRHGLFLESRSVRNGFFVRR